MTGYVHHDDTPDQLAVKMAQEIRYKINGWKADLIEGAHFPSKLPTKRDTARHEAWLHGALIMLSIALHGDAVHVPEAKTFVEQAPWKEDQS